MFKLLNSTILLGLLLGMPLSLVVSSCSRSSESSGSFEHYDEDSKRAFYNEAHADLYVGYDHNEFEIYRINKLEPRIRVVDRSGLRARVEKHVPTRDRVVVMVSKAAQVGEDFEQEMVDLSEYFKDLGFKNLSIHLASGKPGRPIYKEVNLE